MLATLEDHPHARAVIGGALPPEGSPSHAYLFHGPPGAGKRAAARAFAAALLSEGSSDPAGAAARVEHGTHPDLTWVVPTGATEMRVSDIDEPVVAAASHTPFESRRRVFVIEGAELMNDNAANRLLKTLEEPAPFAHIVLVTDRLSAVLPTIASRCQAVRFDTAAPEEIAARALRGAPPESALACARLSLGDAERGQLLGQFLPNNPSSLINSASTLLSQLTQFTGVVVTPRRTGITLRQVEFVHGGCSDEFFHMEDPSPPPPPTCAPTPNPSSAAPPLKLKQSGWAGNALPARLATIATNSPHQGISSWL